MVNYPSTNGNDSVPITGPIYIWFFGWVGDRFYPKYQLGISQSMMIQVAKNLSETFGKKNLALLTAVDEILGPRGTISASMIPTIKSYVSELRKFAFAVYGRLDFDQFNLTSKESLFKETALYINTFQLSGVWFDHAVSYFDTLGDRSFNKMMQSLTKEFPGAEFILNHTAKNGTITELPGYNWERSTYITPSTVGSLVVNQKEIQDLNKAFPGHVLLHLDADGPSPLGNKDEAMSLFGALTGSKEISKLYALSRNGTHPRLANESYSMIYPMVGSWDYINKTFDGVLYNSLPTGNFARSTFPSFEKVILETTR